MEGMIYVAYLVIKHNKTKIVVMGVCWRSIFRPVINISTFFIIDIVWINVGELIKS